MTDTAQLSPITREEITSQPTCWRTAIHLAEAGVTGLPERGERVLLLGCGTSYYVGHAYALMRENAGQGITDALVASELPPAFRVYDRVIAISRSGTSSELLDAVRHLRTQQPSVSVTALLGEQGTPLADLVDHVVDLSFADERSLVQTRFPTTQLALLRTALGHDTVAVSTLGDRGETALASLLPAADVRQVVFLATGWGVPLGQEAALKVRESSGAWVESYPMGEYRHGPVATCAPGTLVWGLEPVPEDIVDLVTAAGGVVEHGSGDPLVELVRVHRFAIELASLRGRDADRPALLSRSVIL